MGRDYLEIAPESANNPTITFISMAACIVTIKSTTNKENLFIGTSIPVAYDRSKILLTKDETVEVNLKVANNMSASDGAVLIPAGAEVGGKFQPAGAGTQFIAQKLIFPNGESQSLNAAYEIVTTTETIDGGTNVGNLIQNAAVGTAAGAAISALTGGKFSLQDRVIGAGTDVLTRLIPTFLGMQSIDLISVEPQNSLKLTLREDFIPNSAATKVK